MYHLQQQNPYIMAGILLPSETAHCPGPLSRTPQSQSQSLCYLKRVLPGTGNIEGMVKRRNSSCSGTSIPELAEPGHPYGERPEPLQSQHRERIAQYEPSLSSSRDQDVSAWEQRRTQTKPQEQQQGHPAAPLRVGMSLASRSRFPKDSRRRRLEGITGSSAQTCTRRPFGFFQIPLY